MQTKILPENFYHKAALGLVVFIYRFLNGSLDLLRFMLFGPLRLDFSIKNILFFRVGNIGDTICAVPAMVLIRNNFPNAHITLLSSPGRKGALGAKELFEGAEFIDKLIIYYQEDIKNLKGLIQLCQKLRKEKFDLFIEMPQDTARFRILLRNLLFAKLIGSKQSLGTALNTVRLFRKIQSEFLVFASETQRLIKLFKPYGLTSDGKVSFLLVISREDRDEVDDFISKLSSKKTIAFDPNAKEKRKIWPLGRFAKVGRFLVEKYDLTILILGAPGNTKRTHKLQSLIGHNAIDVAGKFSVLQSIELLKHCRILLSNDTGSVHMAAAANIPVVGIYAAAHLKNKWDPFGTSHIILRKEPECHTCYLENCIKKRVCLKMITVGEVCEKVSEALGKIEDQGDLIEKDVSLKEA